MKKIYLTLAIAILGMVGLNAQSTARFGITGGLLNVDANIKLSALGFNIADIDAINETGFYVGAFADIAATNKLHIQPEFLYSKAGDLGFFHLPVMVKYYIADKFNLQFGPELSFSTDLNDIKDQIKSIEELIDENLNVEDALRTTGVDLAFGAGYDINENFMVQARYAIELTDRYSGPLGGSIDVKPGMLFVGVGYRF